MAQAIPPAVSQPATDAEDVQTEQLDRLMRVTKPSGWIAFVLLVTIVIVALVWSIAGTYSSNATGLGILLRPPGIYRVQTPEDGIITELEPSIGDTIQQGQVVAQLQTSSGSTEAITSAETGRVVQVVVAPFQYVTTATVLVSVEPLTDQLEAVVYVPAEEGKNVHQGMHVQLTATGVSGTISGTVRQVSTYPATQARINSIVQNNTLNDQLTGGGPVYEIRVEVDPRSASGVTSGTVCTAEIILKQQLPISLIFPQAASR